MKIMQALLKIQIFKGRPGKCIINNTGKKVYQDIKRILSIQGNNTRYFTFEFFQDFITAYKTRCQNLQNNIDDSYYNNNVLLFHCYDSIYKSKFYNKNVGSYCEFLSIFHSWEA